MIDCTGRATTRAGAQAHLDRGAKRVLVSAPSKTRQDCDAVLLPGINLDTFDPAKHKIVSMASCTTNALAPVVKVVIENFGIEYGLFSTVHAYTNTQSLTDQPMKDRRDSWAAAENIIPSSSGAAKALLVHLERPQDHRQGLPRPDAHRQHRRAESCSSRPVDGRPGQRCLPQGGRESRPLKGVMGVLEDEWASSRIVGDPHSSIVDLPLTPVQGDLLSVAAWYDNEWGFTSRLAETAALLVDEAAPVARSKCT